MQGERVTSIALGVHKLTAIRLCRINGQGEYHTTACRLRIFVSAKRAIGEFAAKDFPGELEASRTVEAILIASRTR
jgi:hypothetical protein